jgi:hypothetical protein
MAYSTLNTKIANIDQEDFFETTLKTAVTDATDTNIYLNTLPTPTEGFLTIDPTNTSKREVIFYNAKGADYVTVPSAAIGRGVSGTAQGHDVSSVVRLSDASKYFTFLRDRIISLNTGWIPADQSWAYASANTITVPSGATAIYSVGDKIKITQTTVKYFYVTAVADTTLTVTGGTDYTVANDAITSPYYSKATSPVGFPNNMIARARAKRSTNQTIGTGSWTKVQLNSETFDVGSNFDDTTNYRFTAPITGYYQVNASTQWADPAGSDFYTKIYKNGSGIATAASHNITANILTQSLSDIVQLNAGGYVELYVYQTSGGNKSINNETYMSVALLSLT